MDLNGTCLGKSDERNKMTITARAHEAAQEKALKAG